MIFAALVKLPLTDPQMGSEAWIFMSLGWLAVTSLACWCFWRVLGGGPEQ